MEVFFNFFLFFNFDVARGNVVFKVIWYKPEGRGFEARLGEYIFSICLILPASLGAWVYSFVRGRTRPARKADVLAAICEPTV
jgi:hypothetical protein